MFPMHAIAVTISTSLPDGTGHSKLATRWAHTDEKGRWSSATAGGADFREHQDEAAARKALAIWLRGQADRVENPRIEAKPSKPEPIVEALASTAGLEDLL